MTSRPYRFGADDGYGWQCDGCLTVWRSGPGISVPLDRPEDCPACLARVAMDRVAQLESALERERSGVACPTT